MDTVCEDLHMEENSASWLPIRYFFTFWSSKSQFSSTQVSFSIAHILDINSYGVNKKKRTYRELDYTSQDGREPEETDCQRMSREKALSPKPLSQILLLRRDGSC